MSRPVKQLLVGLFALPLSMVPFAAYGTMTPEGRLVRDRAVVTLSPPQLPQHVRVSNPPRYTGGVAVLVYHGIGSGADGDGDHGFAVSTKRFGLHLAALKAAGMHAVTASDVAAAMAGQAALPPNAVMISFDDGRADAMMFADPLLKQAHMKATMFVIAERAEQHGVYYASWDALTAAAKTGRWDLESHTANLHFEQRVADGRLLPALTSLAPGESMAQYRQRVRRDLAKASAMVAHKTGHRPVAFAYPFGAYGAERANSPLIQRVLAEEVARQYQVAFHQDGQDSMVLAMPGQQPLGLRRLEVGDWSPSTLLSRIGAAAQRSGAAAPGTVVGEAHDVPDVPAAGSLALAAGPGPVDPATTTTTVVFDGAQEDDGAGPSTASRPAVRVGSPSTTMPAPSSSPSPPAPTTRTSTTTTSTTTMSTTTMSTTTMSTTTMSTTTTSPPRPTTTTTTTTVPPTTTTTTTTVPCHKKKC